MANSKHAHFRYNVLDYCFRNLELSKKDLLSYLNNRLDENYDGEQIQLRQLDSDLDVFRRELEGFNAPLPPNIRTYKYTDTEFSIATKPLLEYEQYLVDATIKLLERFENHPKYNKLAEALIKFQDEEEQDSDFSQIMYYDHNEEYKGIRFLKPLYLAIKKKQVLQVTYKAFRNDFSNTYIFHPYILKQYNRRWFVYGLNKTREIEEWSIPLDERLVDFKPLEDLTYEESKTDWETFFRTMVGVRRSQDANIERVVLRFFNGRENYFKTKPFIADFDEFFEEEKQGHVWFETIINPELVQQLLSYGSDVEVIEPESLRIIMKKESRGINLCYNDN